MDYSLIRLIFLSMLLSSVSTVRLKDESKFVKEAHTRLVIDTSNIVATVNVDKFMCATLDWWPPSKCDYGPCPWGQAGILDLDLENPLLEKTLAELAPFMVRVGGTLQDLVVYNVGDLLSSEPCVPFAFDPSSLFSYTGGCLHMERWDALNRLFMKTGTSVVFGLSALYGRSKSSTREQIVRPWNSRNAENFMRYTRDRAYPVIAWELGNELMGKGQTGKSVSPEVYALDVKKLRRIIDKLYRQGVPKPSLVAPDTLYKLQDTDNIVRFLNASGKGVVDVVTRHIYTLGAGVAETSVVINNVLNDSNAKAEIVKYKTIQSVLKEHPMTSAWVGEAGGVYNNGHPEVSNAFISAFWYLDQLGTASRYNNQAFCRQTFVGGFYGILDVNFNPNPDYYGALLWQQLMGSGVFAVDIRGGNTDVRAYAHCQRNSQSGVTLLVLNYSNSTRQRLDLSLVGYSADHNRSPSNFQALITSRKCEEDECLTSNEASSEDVRLEYHMSPANNSLTSRTVLLNGQPLLVTPSGDIPTLSPVKVNMNSPISLAPLTYAYVVIPGANPPACAASKTSGGRMSS
ncbi:hypothetical protein R1flu_001708 [Riccia fluitans]|uniref:Heparanase-like protein 3 n=1 Tax=Riccia fluitans TaxID=41844 RepID=A0ABD1Y415_9MARC